jgi:hypothetical protein
VKWRDELLAQMEFYWDHNLWPRLRGLTDEEYFWEPVPGCWSVRERPDGAFVMDWDWPAPEPPPVATIAWRMAHIGVRTLGLRANALFGDGSWTVDTIRWPKTAPEALRALAMHYEHWRTGARTMAHEDEDTATSVILHMNREIIHQGAQIALLRDLHRARASPPFKPRESPVQTP